ncbi:MAG: DUF4198 domain-containing protein [Lentisphaeria bacterium]|nr:DUF4198 domain-containing protein [Lentisphaeria bacterium]
MNHKIIVATLACFIGALTARGHFQTLLPSTDLAGQEARTIDLDIQFTHPMEGGPVMDMGAPARFGVVLNGKTKDLTSDLIMRRLNGMRAFSASYTVKTPGDHLFFIEPAPYWEPAEGKWIIHYTKVIVNAFGAEDGWDQPIGLPVEIRPLTRPYGLWTGNLFRGVVLQDGQPVPFAEIEVEYWNPQGDVEIPGDAFITQVIRADANGLFAYAMPRAGWWAFAALIEGGARPAPDGSPAGVELGGLIWVHCVDMRPRVDKNTVEKGTATREGMRPSPTGETRQETSQSGAANDTEAGEDG